jgi:hypothetical protein
MMVWLSYETIDLYFEATQHWKQRIKITDPDCNHGPIALDPTKKWNHIQSTYLTQLILMLQKQPRCYVGQI